MKQENRRKKPLTRTEMNNCQGLIVRGDTIIEVEIKDQEHGGIGIIIPEGTKVSLRDKFKVTFPLTPGIEYTELFKVVAIKGNRVGLQYANHSIMSPRQRWETWTVKIGKQGKKKSRKITKAPSNIFSPIVYFIKGLF
jgi:hypothetical protein